MVWYDIRGWLPDKEGLRTWIFITCGIQIILGLIFFISGALAIGTGGTLGGVFSIISAIVGVVATFFRSDVLKIVFLGLESLMVLCLVLIMGLTALFRQAQVSAAQIVAGVAIFVVLLTQIAGIAEIGYYLWLKKHPAAEPTRRNIFERHRGADHADPPVL